MFWLCWFGLFGPRLHLMQANPADEYMDIITGLVRPFTATGTKEGLADLPSLWAAHSASEHCAAGDICSLGADEVGKHLACHGCNWIIHTSYLRCWSLSGQLGGHTNQSSSTQQRD